ncbi:MAG: COG4315 family predicted lipoprotein [Acidimicrobiales bacterium]
MRKPPIYAAVVAGALALAACGSNDDGNSDPSSAAASTDGSPTLSVERVDGLGDVLVDDQTGLALYTSEQEANGQVLCVDTCEAFWSPLEAGDTTPTTEPGVAELGEIARPDGTQQVTADGVPLYTFTEDSPGEVTGDGFSDDFDGQLFTWHVVQTDGASTSSSSGDGSTGDGNAPGGADDGFNY